VDSVVVDFLDVTEMAGEPISPEQLDRLANRYIWASAYCRDKDVAEIACGTGPGLGLLDSVARNFEAGDISDSILGHARNYYGDRIRLSRIDAQNLPYADGSKDVLILFEAIYYLEDIDQFINECKRVLRPDGYLLIATANKDLADFNPSPHSQRYLGVSELASELRSIGSDIEIFGYLDVTRGSWKQRVLRPVKRLFVSLNLMPKTMASKRLLKRLVFGSPVSMPAEIDVAQTLYNPPDQLRDNVPDHRHKVIYCAVKRD
jgi:SAM-dependent methyltransferase